MTKESLDELAHSLAYDFAASVIDGDCTPMSDEALTADNMDEWWYSVVDVRQDTQDCVRYLEARGLLERHLDHPDWIRVRDESEATA